MPTVTTGATDDLDRVLATVGCRGIERYGSATSAVRSVDLKAMGIRASPCLRQSARVIPISLLTGQVAFDQPDSKSSEICARVAGRSAAVAARAKMEVLANMLKKKVNECGERNVSTVQEDLAEHHGRRQRGLQCLSLDYSLTSRRTAR